MLSTTTQLLSSAGAVPLTPMLILLATATAAVYLVVRAIMPKPLPGIPYNKEASGNIFGDIPAMQIFKRKHGSARLWIQRQLEKHDSTLIQLFLDPWSSKSTIVVGDYREFHDISLRRTKEFDRSYMGIRDFAPIVPENQLVLRSHDPRFKASKELMKDLMTPTFLNEVSAPAVYVRALNIVDIWEEKRRLAKGRPFSCKEDLTQGALDMIIGVAFPIDKMESAMLRKIKMLRGIRDSDDVPYAVSNIDVPYNFPEIEVPKENQAAADVIYSIGLIQNSPAPSLHYWILKKIPWLRNATTTKNRMIRENINEAVPRLTQPDAEPTCAMDRMILREIRSAKKASRAPDFHSQKMYDELFGYLTGGSDTTATTMSWFAKYIADHPAAQTTLRSALHAAHATAKSERRNPTATEITKTSIPYLDATVEELLRCAGTLPLIGRDALVDTTVLGHAIPKNTTILFLTRGPGMYLPPIGKVDDHVRSPSSKNIKGEWDVADIGAFKPERWLVVNDQGEEEFDSAAGPMMAFGGGPRGCFGRRLAYMELKVVFTILLWNFEFLKLPEELRSYEALDLLTTLPKIAHIRVKRVDY